jgi:hypothetical protein
MFIRIDLLHPWPPLYSNPRSTPENREIKNEFKRWLSLSTTGNGVLTIFHTKMSKLLRERLALWCSFIKLGTPSHLFSFHKSWLTDSIRCPPTFTYHGGVPFFFFSFWNKRMLYVDPNSTK